MRLKPNPNYSYEAAARTAGRCRVVGVDEVGRGPLAGPVTAAAVWLDPDCIPEGLNDSKALNAKTRERLFVMLMACAEVSVAHASVEEIDEINILQASHLAMRRAIDGLSVPCDHALIDGNRAPKGLSVSHEAIVKGDGLSVSIAAASIVAKVVRDRLMRALAADFPGYGWETNAGYGAPVHKKALLDLGVTPHHRRSFAPVYNILYPQKT